MGSGASRSSGVKITRVEEFKQDNSTSEQEDQPVTSAGIPSVDTNGQQKSEVETDATASTDTACKTGTKYSLGQDLRESLAEVEAIRRDEIALHRAQELQTPITPIPVPVHYVEKNEGGMLVEDVEESLSELARNSGLNAVDGKDSDRWKEADSKKSFRDLITSVPEKRWMTPKETPQSRHSLPDGEHDKEKLTPVHGSGAKRLGVSGQALISQLQNQGIITAEAARFSDTSNQSILGELTHLGLIRDGESEVRGNVVYDESNRRKIPARLSKLQQQSHTQQPTAFPTPEEKRRKIRTRSHAIGCGFQLNEDVVSNALQRACVRERRPTPAVNQQKLTESKELVEKITSVELL